MRPYESIDAAATRWTVNPKTIRRMVDRGEIVAYRVGQQLRVNPDEVDAAMQPVPAAGGAS
jgi:excisionase family DNA binding protein